MVIAIKSGDGIVITAVCLIQNKMFSYIPFAVVSENDMISNDLILQLTGEKAMN